VPRITYASGEGGLLLFVSLSVAGSAGVM